ncbi:hypothetical protein GCM10027047_02020 [Rhodococcus aerolatus]
MSGEVSPGDAGWVAHRLHGGDGEVRVRWPFVDTCALPVAVQQWELDPGASEGVHAHGDERPLEELYLVCAGTATVRLGDAVHQLGPGDALRAPAGVPHDLRNSGSDVLRVVVVLGAPAPTDFSWSVLEGPARRAR